MATCCFKRCSSPDDEKYCEPTATLGQQQSEENNNELQNDGEYSISNFIKQPEKRDIQIHANPPLGCYRPQPAKQASDVAQSNTGAKSQQQVSNISLEALDRQAAENLEKIGHYNIQTQQDNLSPSNPKHSIVTDNRNMVQPSREQHPTLQQAAVNPTSSCSVVDCRYETTDTVDGTSIDWKRPPTSEQDSSHIPSSPTATNDRHNYEKLSATTHGSDNNYNTYDKLGQGLYESINSRSTTSYAIIPERYSGMYDSIKTVNSVDSYLRPNGNLVVVGVYDDTQRGPARQSAEITFADEASRDDGKIHNHFNTWSGNEQHVKRTLVQQQQQLQVGQTWSPQTNFTISTQF